MRYLPLTEADRSAMLEVIGAPSVDALFADVPAEHYLDAPLEGLPLHASEMAVERQLTKLARKNLVAGEVPFSTVTVDHEERSRDGSVKLRMLTHDGFPLEAVLSAITGRTREIPVGNVPTVVAPGVPVENSTLPVINIAEGVDARLAWGPGWRLDDGCHGWRPVGDGPGERLVANWSGAQGIT